jgi:hypothetical protein
MGSVIETQNTKCWKNTNFGVSKCCKNVLIFSFTCYYISLRNISIISNFIWDNIKRHKTNSKSPVHRKIYCSNINTSIILIFIKLPDNSLTTGRVEKENTIVMTGKNNFHEKKTEIHRGGRYININAGPFH